MINEYNSSQKAALYSGIIMLVAAIPLKYLFIRHGIHFSDEPFQMTMSLNFKGEPLVSLSAFISGMIAKTFGLTWIGYRYLAYIYFSISLGLVCWYLWYKTHNLPLVSIVTGFLFLLLSVYQTCAFNLFGYDSPSALMITVTLILMLEYIDSPTMAKALSLGISTSIAALMRAPNIAMAPLIILSMIYCGYKHDTLKKSMMQIVAYLGVCLVTATIVIVLLFGGINQYLDALQQNSTSDHDFSNLILPAIRQSYYSILIGLTLLPVFALFKLIEKIPNKPIRVIIAACTVVPAAIFLFRSSDLIYFTRYNYLFSVTFYVFLLALCKVKPGNRFKIIVIALFCAISAVGSNTGLYKINYFAAAALLVIYYVPRRAAMYTVFSAMLALTAFYTRDTLFFGFLDTGALNANTPVSVPFAKGLLTGEQRARYIESIDSIFGKYAADTTVCTVSLSCTNNRYYTELVYDSPNPARLPNWSTEGCFNDPEFVKASMEYIEAPRPKPMVVMYLREDGSYLNQPHFTPTLMENALRERLDSIEGNDLCTVFITR